MPPKLLELLQAGNFAAIVNELRQGRLEPTPNSTSLASQYDPKLHKINDPLERPDKLVVVDQKSEDYGQVTNINPNAEQPVEGGYRIERVARIALAIQS